MQFSHLKIIQCPHCRTMQVVAEGVDKSRWSTKPQINQHCNGQRWEWREFLCGYKVKWIPNFEAPEVQSTCSMDPDVIKQREARDAASRALEDFVNGLDVDSQWKKWVLTLPHGS